MSPKIICLVVLAAVAVPTTFAERCLRDNVLPGPPNQLYSGQIDFAFNMLGAMQRKTLPKNNIFFSPYSLYNALLLAYLGSDDRSAYELEQALGLQWASSKDEVGQAYRKEKQQLTYRLKRLPLELSIVDRIFIDETAKVADCWTDQFSDEIGSLDFGRSFGKVRQDINKWFETNTRDAIPELLTSSDDFHSFRSILASGANFEGEWLEVFDNRKTRADDFFIGTNKRASVKMMHQADIFRAATIQELDAEVLQLPYATGMWRNSRSEISMLVFLPKAKDDYSLDTLIKNLTTKTLQMTLRRLFPKYIVVSFPKFVLEKNVEMDGVLRMLGIRTLFNEPNALIDFFTGSKMVLDLAKHAARIKVDEVGNGGTIIKPYRKSRKPVDFNCNRPFLFLIYDHRAKTVLFTGIYRNPTES